MIRNALLIALLSLPLAASSARANEIVVTADSDALVSAQFSYRYMSTRDWLLGCLHYDVLQGSGWFPATWYHDVDLAPGASGLSARYRRSWYEWYCNAQMDDVNTVTFQWRDPSDPDRIYTGRFSVDPNSTASSAAVDCALTDAASTWNHISCDAVTADLNRSGALVLRVSVSGLD